MKLTKQQKEELKEQLKEQKWQEKRWEKFIENMKAKGALLEETKIKKRKK